MTLGKTLPASVGITDISSSHVALLVDGRA